MNQTLHIFRKDVRYLWPQIALLLAATAVFGWNEIRGLTQAIFSGWAEILVEVAAVYLIVTLIHAEAIPGDRQYWLTRPYAWKGLLGAKLLFILTFVNLPVLLAHLVILLAGDFPLGTNVPGLLWSQVLLVVCMELPVVALAAVTASIPAFLFAAMSLIAIDYGVSLLMQRSAQPWLEAVSWVRSALLPIGLLAIAAAVLYQQYKRRTTMFSRGFALAGTALLSVAYLVLPWPLAFAVQSLPSKPLQGAALQFSLAPSSNQVLPSGQHRPQVQVRLPLSIQGVPDGVDLQANAMTVTMSAPDGRTWNTPLRPMADLVQHKNAQPAMLPEDLFVDRGFFNQERDRPLTVHVLLYLTLFGDERERTVPIQREPVNVIDGLRCFTIPANIGWDVYCRSLFRWPAEAVYARVGSAQTSFTKLISFSPFPANLKLGPVELHWAPVYPIGPRPEIEELAIIVKNPVAHLRRYFELHDVRLADVAIPWRIQSVVRNRVYHLEQEY